MKKRHALIATFFLVFLFLSNQYFHEMRWCVFTSRSQEINVHEVFCLHSLLSDGNECNELTTHIDNNAHVCVCV